MRTFENMKQIVQNKSFIILPSTYSKQLHNQCLYSGIETACLTTVTGERFSDLQLNAAHQWEALLNPQNVSFLFGYSQCLANLLASLTFLIF